MAPLALWLSMKRMDLLLIQALQERIPVLAAAKHRKQAPADTTPSATDTESSAN